MEDELLNKKIKGYKLFATFYNLFSKIPGRKKSAFLVMTHDGGNTGNCGTVLLELKRRKIRTHALRREDTAIVGNLSAAFRFFVIKSFQMARARTIFLDNVFLPMGFCDIPKDVQVAMLWHGTCTIKRFGLDTTVGALRELEAAADSKITHLFVGSDYTKKIYAGCFGLSEDKIYVTGSPRCDSLFKAQEDGEDLRDKNKFTVLYATTFREGLPGEVPYYDLRRVLKKFYDHNRDIQVLLRLHPHVASELEGRSEFIMYGNCIDVSRQDNLNSIMKKADLLITDYSSICYDFMILDRPVLFYAPDLEYYRDSERGFYEDYEAFVPGHVFTKADELAEEIINMASSTAKPVLDEQERFMDIAFKYKDHNATARIMEVLGL